VSRLAANMQTDAKPQPAPEYYRPDESSRLEQARRWIRQARTSEGSSKKTLFDENNNA